MKILKNLEVPTGNICEDLGLITCGNAILSGSEPRIPFKTIL